MSEVIKVEMKQCRKCREVKPLNAFDKSKDGRCKPCRAEANREYKSSPKGRAMDVLSQTRTNRRRAEKELGHPIEDTLNSYDIAMVQSEDRCLYCGHPVEFGKMTVDHVKTFRHGGTNTYANLLPSCHICNSRKGDKPILEFLRKYATSLQLRRVIDRLSQRKGIGYYDMYEQLRAEVEPIESQVTSSA
jgi:5-methylcytosine-specific restriction endonuclease McrA